MAAEAAIWGQLSTQPLGLELRIVPGLESANEIGGAFDAELAQRCGRQA
jgi:hypothetical protein